MEIALLGSKSGVNLESGSEGMNFLRALDRVTVSTAPMCQDHGDWIAAQGVHLVQVYGLTEAGCCCILTVSRRSQLAGDAPFPQR
ncbi:hypothetical protein CC1G_02874 [Coprinopsis cinerea okayama7|uniref:Uncharacterized protein n=1 Tax=Coprinopsis cinerea (strain Okayama-7 / 130 / ATCC MYA-4618 / FGSC 9003) TaxID=240176 RepID=A8N0A5_COPC7|nr:hypothetical protein CC1G_02874 [Coprinopsis cinerea okayama7\|eukprot:XP_001828293.2 hypothetical protein CC1G_02874 [Coprinopsis cinerea okayama7\